MLITNIAALQALDPSTVTEEVVVEGYYAPADKGGGVFFWDTISPVATANNGTIIASTVPGYTTSGRWKRIYSGAINVLWFGAKGDGTTIDNAAFSNAAATGEEVAIPQTDAFYALSASIHLSNNISGIGLPILKFSIITCLICDQGNIEISNLHIESTANKDNVSAGPILVYSLDKSGITIRDCALVNGRIQIYNDQYDFEKNCCISGNKIDFDFTNVEHLSNQNDVVTIRGIENVLITNNVLNVVDCHRVFKLQNTTAGDTTPDNPYRCRRLFICDNVVIAQTDSGKQVMDLYNYSTDLFLTNNYFEVSGFGSLIENKSGTQTTYSQNSKISGNTFAFDGSGIIFQGSLGNDSIETDTGYQNIIISGNQFESRTESVSTGFPISIRFFHSVNIYGNDIRHYEDNPGLVAITISANQKSVIEDNILHSGYILLNTASTNMSGQTFTDKFSSAVVSNNIVRDFGNGASGGIWVTGINAATGNIVITGNDICQLTDDTSISAAPVFFRANTLKNVVVTGNNGVMANAAEERLFFYGTTNVISRIVEGNNSWNVRSLSATYDPASIAAGASLTTSAFTITGVLAGDWVDVSFSNSLSGLILSAYVSGTNVVTAVFFNPTAAAVDLASGTLKFKVIRTN